MVGAIRVMTGARGRGRVLVVHRTVVRFRSDHRQTEDQHEQDAYKRHGPNYTVFVFQRPRRNSTMLATARVENAIVTAHATPCGPIPKRVAST